MLFLPRRPANGVLYTYQISQWHTSKVTMLFLSISKFHFFDESSTSPRSPSDFKPSPFTINDMLTLFFNEQGTGCTTMQDLGTLIPRSTWCIWTKTFQNKKQRFLVWDVMTRVKLWMSQLKLCKIFMTMDLMIRSEVFWGFAFKPALLKLENKMYLFF